MAAGLPQPRAAPRYSSVALFLIDYSDKVALILRDGSAPRYPWHYGMPGSLAQLGETFEAAAVRTINALVGANLEGRLQGGWHFNFVRQGDVALPSCSQNWPTLDIGATAGLEVDFTRVEHAYWAEIRADEITQVTRGFAVELVPSSAVFHGLPMIPTDGLMLKHILAETGRYSGNAVARR